MSGSSSSKSTNQPPIESGKKQSEKGKVGHFWDENGCTTYYMACVYAEQGQFQKLLIAVCLCGATGIALCSSILQKYPLDIQTTSEDIAILNKFLYIAMIFGGPVWSVPTDRLSRKWSLFTILLLNTFASIALLFANNFRKFLFAKALLTFSSSATTPTIIVYLVEFQGRYNRSSVVCSFQVAWFIGTFLPNVFCESSFALMVLIAILLTLFAAISLLFFPDSPRFYLSRNQQQKAIDSFQTIHQINTGKQYKIFPIKYVKEDEALRRETVDRLLHHIVTESEKYLIYSYPILFFTQFMLFFSYYTMGLWFPHLQTRENLFLSTDRRIYSMQIDCTPLTNLQSQKEEAISNVDFIKIAVTSIPGMAWLIVKVDIVGRKFFIRNCIAGVLVFASFVLFDTRRDLIFSCFFEAVMIFSIAGSQCIAVDLSYTTHRTFGVALLMAFGQIGMILGYTNTILMLEWKCAHAIALIAILLTTSGVLAMSLPMIAGRILK